MNQRKLAVVLLAPAFLLVAFTTIYPLISSFWTSFHVFNLARSLELGRFVGFENYTWTPSRTIRISGRSCASRHLRRGRRGADDPGRARASPSCCSEPASGRRVLRTLIILPFAMSPALIGISWRFMLNPDYGAFARTIAAVLPFMRNVDYLASPDPRDGGPDLVGRLALGALLHLHADGRPRLDPAGDAGGGPHRWRQQLAASSAM